MRCKIGVPSQFSERHRGRSLQGAAAQIGKLFFIGPFGNHRQERDGVGRLRLRRIDSIGGLRDVAAAWDRLWQRSAVSMPTVRAELVAQWLEQDFEG